MALKICKECGTEVSSKGVCPKCGKTTKVGYSEEKGEKIRVCKKCGAKLK